MIRLIASAVRVKGASAYVFRMSGTFSMRCGALCTVIVNVVSREACHTVLPAALAVMTAVPAPAMLTAPAEVMLATLLLPDV